MPTAPFDRAWKDEGKWYFSWGYSRQQYAPSDIHVSQPSLGNDFTLHQVKASDYPGRVGDAVNSLFKLDFTSPQENVRIGYFLNPEKTFAIELNYDHSKYNNDVGQSVRVCCLNSRDWWQVNGWTAGAELGLRYRIYKSIYFEATQKFAYGALRGVPVYQGSADHSVWMSEQVFSTGFMF